MSDYFAEKRRRSGELELERAAASHIAPGGCFIPLILSAIVIVGAVVVMIGLNIWWNLTDDDSTARHEDDWVGAITCAGGEKPLAIDISWPEDEPSPVAVEGTVTILAEPPGTLDRSTWKVLETFEVEGTIDGGDLTLEPVEGASGDLVWTRTVGPVTRQSSKYEALVEHDECTSLVVSSSEG